ncbi:MAG: TlpA disulfide reductase family protein [Bacteroidota bacterium]
MKKNLKFISALLLLVIVVCGCGDEHIQDSTATIKIKSEKYKNHIFQFYLPFSRIIKFNLNSNGEGMVSIPLKKLLFVNFSVNDSILSTLLLEPGYNLFLNLEKGIASFSGKGDNPNNYLLKSKLLLNYFVNSSKKKANDLESFIALCDSFELQYAAFHKKYSDSIAFTKEIDYLLKNQAYASVLFEKQMYLSSFDQHEIDSLNLEEKLWLLNNNIYKDTLLIKTHCTDFLLFLIYNCERDMAKFSLANQQEKELYPVMLLEKIKESTKYSREIKEFLIFNNLFGLLDLYGLTSNIDSISKMVKETYPHSEYLITLSDKYQKLNNLTTGNPAPHFQGTTLEGEIYSLSDLKGKVVFIDVWATWCGPCIAALPLTHNLQESFKNNKNVVFLFISIDQKENDWRKYVTQHQELKGIQIRVVDQSFKELYKITGIPRYIIIDKHGNIADAFAATPSDQKVRGLIEKMLLK